MRTAVVFDLEFTAWEGSMAHHWLRPGEFREVVQIGAVRLDAGSLEEVATFDAFIRPRINPVLSEYFERLTGITNADVKREGRDFAAAFAAFLAFSEGAAWFAFGRDDLVLRDNCRLYGLGSPPFPEFYDARPWFRANGVDTRGLHSCNIGPKLGVPLNGRKHNALTDARSVAAGMKVLVARGAKSLFSGMDAAARTAA